jgi:hypothetical protein
MLTGLDVGPTVTLIQHLESRTANIDLLFLSLPCTYTFTGPNKSICAKYEGDAMVSWLSLIAPKAASRYFFLLMAHLG